MTRRISRRSPKPPQRPAPETRAANLRLRGKPPQSLQTANSVPTDLKAGIIANWELPSDNINTCVPPERWPYNEPDAEKWHIDIVHLLHEASRFSKGNNEIFQLDLKMEIHSRQLKNKSAKGKAEYMTATDLKKVCKRLESMQEGKKAVEKKGEQKESSTKPTRRGRSTRKPTDDIQTGDAQETEKKEDPQAQKAVRGRARPKTKEPDEEDPIKPSTKRQASDLPIRPARKLRGGASPKTALLAPPPITPANPPEASDDDAEPSPPDPVSGAHIYGALIKPTTLAFHAGGSPAVPGRTRPTRKRARAEPDAPPADVHIDPDPRDIDATGFLSELDPREMRRRRKPRLSRLQQERVADLPWSQEMPAPPETPLSTPATEGPVLEAGAPPPVGVAAVSSPAAPVVSRGKDADSGIKMLLGLLPGIPDAATAEERSMLEDRVALIHRDVIAYKTAVLEINERVEV